MDSFVPLVSSARLRLGAMGMRIAFVRAQFSGGVARRRDKFFRVFENEFRLHCLERSPAVVTPGHRGDPNSNLLASFDVPSFVANEQNLCRANMLPSDDTANHPRLAKKLGRTTNEIEQLQPVTPKKNLHVDFGVRCD